MLACVPYGEADGFARGRRTTLLSPSRVRTQNHGEVMKRLWLGVTILGAIAVLAGCPIYSDSSNYRVCTSTACYDCPDPTLSNACIEWQCGTSADCGAGYVCNGNACAPETAAATDAASASPEPCRTPMQCPIGSVCGQDETCHGGDCAYWGCPPGFGCFRGAYGEASCIEDVDTIDATGGSSSSDASVEAARDAATTATGDGAAEASWDASSNALTDAPPAVSAEASLDAADAAWVDAAGDAQGPLAAALTPCNFDGQCGGGGSRCVNGNCTPQSGLCSDGTQCSAGESCVDGECTPHCSAALPCAIGFECDLNRGVCSLNSTVCASTADCLGGTVCVQAHCVAPCSSPDAGAICPATEVCANGGCIPNQAASFACTNDGYTGPVANSCELGAICLHDDCYVECSLDGGVCTAGQVCKEVTTLQGTFAVCGPPSELGSECDSAAGLYCPPGELCIDGYCK